MSAEPILVMKDICKSFPGVVALKDAQLRLFPGEVHAVMGQNGAGKSTLIKALTGVELPDSGEIRLKGQAIQPTSVNEPRFSISPIFQWKPLEQVIDCDGFQVGIAGR